MLLMRQIVIRVVGQLGFSGVRLSKVVVEGTLLDLAAHRRVEINYIFSCLIKKP